MDVEHGASGTAVDLEQHGSGVAYHITGITDSGLHGSASGHYTHGGMITIMDLAIQRT